jgi:hypothetical protein
MRRIPDTAITRAGIADPDGQLLRTAPQGEYRTPADQERDEFLGPPAPTRSLHPLPHALGTGLPLPLPRRMRVVDE